MPAHDVSPLEGKFLYLLAKIKGAKRILEIGTLGAYSTIWFAKALPVDGRIITLEYDEKHAIVAKENIEKSSYQSQIELIQGRARSSLENLIAQKVSPFDLIFIDADKASNPEYLVLVLQLAKSGTVIVGDNVVRNGEIINSFSEDPSVVGIRRYIEGLDHVQHELESTVLQTVGIKGYDGFSISVVR